MIANTVQRAAPRYDPRGWMQWPDHEDYSYRFMQVLGVAQEGSSAISECFLTASRITPGDDESWHREWKKLADACKSRGALAFGQGNIQTAQSNWLRTSNYYRTAELFLGVACPTGPIRTSRAAGTSLGKRAFENFLQFRAWSPVSLPLETSPAISSSIVDFRSSGEDFLPIEPLLCRELSTSASADVSAIIISR